jgi:hypothetical protein
VPEELSGVGAYLRDGVGRFGVAASRIDRELSELASLRTRLRQPHTSNRAGTAPHY